MPSDPMAPGRAPRHAAETASHAARERARNGRHRRPESLADSPPRSRKSHRGTSLADAPAATAENRPTAEAAPATAAWPTAEASPATETWSATETAPATAAWPTAEAPPATETWSATETTPATETWSATETTPATEVWSTGEFSSAEFWAAGDSSRSADLPSAEHSSTDLWATGGSSRWEILGERERERESGNGDGNGNGNGGDGSATGDRRPNAPGIRDAWAFESTSEWLLTARRSRAAGSHRAPDSPAEAHPADAAISAARDAASRLQQDREANDRAAEPTPAATGRHARRHAAAQKPGRRAAARHGKHARPADPLAITVRPVPAVRDALSDRLRAAGAVREWALWTGSRTPATGAHRAPGTLPIESWLLIGKSRQQALLAALVAVGLALVMIPVQRGDDVDPVNTAGRSPVVADKPAKARTEAPPDAAEPERRSSPAKPGKPAAAKPPTPGKSSAAPATPGRPAAPAAPEPAVAVPPGDGPASSLRVTGTRAVALTFDDGPDPVQTPRILAMLKEQGVKATFCVVGAQAQRHPDVVRQIAAAGHTLCNHSWDHSFTLGREKPDAIRADLERTNAAIRAAVPDAKIPFFRAPGGNFTERLVQVAYADGMASLYWEVDPRDWERGKDTDAGAHVQKIVTDVRRTVRPGSIILSHDYDQPETVTAYAELLPWLRNNFELGVPTVPPPAAPDVNASAPPVLP
ncbi:polysaccharide deacetylase family protein [Jidongwangia harbinensis]|uniref:polysaccharide deacetylase family protein n=1 Tax=Jidongwangia harbinensis TaxID=2878561 RepID=UPI001CDA111A|nr:polysaccharide deacetylase family protein [Jidongwangia harbinensis]MCA2213464.1 polysaccharide deacetylase family protein [Jidongwangia harbinensis]